VAPRGAGRTYGDGALNSGQIILDLSGMNRIQAWDPNTGVIRLEPGVTIEQMWRHVLPDGWWPPVVPGTMFATVGGALAMNIHGKNNYRVGPLGEHVVEFTAILPTGEAVTCTPALHGELFHAIIGGAGLLGVLTSVTVTLKRIHSGNLRVHARSVPGLRDMLADLDQLASRRDYVVGWIDATAAAGRTGRGQIHSADHVQAGEDPDPGRTLQVAHQALPDPMVSLIPKTSLWRVMRLMTNDLGVTLVNALKYRYSRVVEHDTEYVQSLVAFNFLLDFVPAWERAYGPDGLIQYQSFVPLDAAADTYAELIGRTHKHGLPAYLGVVKRHRPDRFLFTHSLDGYSLAQDFRVTRHNRRRLQDLADEMNRIVLQAGGRFYFAKDSTLTPDVAAGYLGDDALRRFRALKERCDPDELLQTDLYRRVLRPLLARAGAAAQVGTGAGRQRAPRTACTACPEPSTTGQGGLAS
jgi:FAD/FMN-containing dehydrogenase